MKMEELKTPFGAIHMYINGQKAFFEVEPFRNDVYCANHKEPQGSYKLCPELEKLKKGDILICEFDGGQLENDGGDEFIQNIVGTYRGYTIGMGAPDSEDIEIYYGRGKRALSYETWTHTSRGFEIHILDTPEGVLVPNYDRLFFIVAWEIGVSDDVWEMISFLTG